MPNESAASVVYASRGSHSRGVGDDHFLDEEIKEGNYKEPMHIKHVVEYDDDQIRESRETTLTAQEDDSIRHDFEAQTTDPGNHDGKRTAATATCQYSGAMRLKENRSSN